MGEGDVGQPAGAHGWGGHGEKNGGYGVNAGRIWDGAQGHKTGGARGGGGAPWGQGVCAKGGPGTGGTQGPSWGLWGWNWGCRGAGLGVRRAVIEDIGDIGAGGGGGGRGDSAGLWGQCTVPGNGGGKCGPNRGEGMEGGQRGAEGRGRRCRQARCRGGTHTEPGGIQQRGRSAAARKRKSERASLRPRGLCGQRGGRIAGGSAPSAAQREKGEEEEEKGGRKEGGPGRRGGARWAPPGWRWPDRVPAAPQHGPLPVPSGRRAMRRGGAGGFGAGC